MRAGRAQHRISTWHSTCCTILQVQYLLQLPRLKRQRYLLTQHNPGGWPLAWLVHACLAFKFAFEPTLHLVLHLRCLLADWLLNHPNVDILQQHLLAPLLMSAQAEGPTTASAAAAPAAAPPLLRVQLVTLAPCVSNYTLHFLRQMAFNITEGHTYAGSFAAGILRFARA